MRDIRYRLPDRAHVKDFQAMATKKAVAIGEKLLDWQHLASPSRKQSFALVSNNLKPAALDEETASMARLRHAWMLMQSGDAEKAIVAYDEVIRQFDKKGDNDPALRKAVANAFLNKAYLLGQTAEAVRAYQKFIRRFSKLSKNEPALEVMVGTALFNRAVALSALELWNLAVSAWGEIVGRYDKRSENERELRTTIATALYNKAVALSNLEILDRAIDTWDQIVKRFDLEAADDSVHELVKKAIERAKERESLARMLTARAIVYLEEDATANEAINYLNQAINLKPDFLAFYTRARLWMERREFDHAYADYAEAIRLDPESCVYVAEDYASLSLPNPFANPVEIAPLQTEGPLPSEHITDEQLLDALKKRGIAASLCRLVAAELTKSGERKSKWRDEEKPEELKELSAPKFLAHVHASEITNNTVHKDVIRAFDPDLMDAVEGYISQRKRRGLDLGDAKGLIFISSRPARNTVSRTVSFKRKFGKKAAGIIKAVREVDRSKAQARRQRRRNPSP
jgi:tetratricopeptide (TPR) repeat protein